MAATKLGRAHPLQGAVRSTATFNHILLEVATTVAVCFLITLEFILRALEFFISISGIIRVSLPFKTLAVVILVLVDRLVFKRLGHGVKGRGSFVFASWFRSASWTVPVQHELKHADNFFHWRAAARLLGPAIDCSSPDAIVRKTVG